MAGNSEQDDNSRTHVVLVKGTMVSHYRIVEKIGAGGMGEVYLAEDTRLDRKVALKFLPPHLCQDEDCRVRFKREAQAAAKLNHPNIVTIYEVSEYNDRLFFAMELLEGQSLRDLAKGKELGIDRIIELTIQICDGLSVAHDKKIVHRDIKPSNIVIDAYGQPKILDFGLAAIQGAEQLTKTGSILGTVGYMSPEQSEGKETDHRTDIWSLGVVLYEMLTGRLPFKRDHEQATIYAILNEEPEPPGSFRSGIPQYFEQIILRALEKDRNRRYQSIQLLLQDLQTLTVSQITAPEQEKSLIVLPFKNMSPDPDQEYFSDGLTEEIITDLSQIRDLLVISRSSAMTLKGTKKKIREIAKEVNVRYVLEGSVRKAGNNLRITAQLINAANDSHLWAEKYKGTLDDVFDIQEKVSHSIADALAFKLLGSENEGMVKRYTEDLEAYNFYLKGLYFRRNLTEKDINQAIEYFNRAIEIDPEYALAYAGLAYSYMVLAFYTPVSPKEAYPKAKGAALRALELDNQIPEAHESMAAVHAYFEWSWENAERECRKIIELNPGYAWGHFHYANLLLAQMKPDAAMKEMQEAHKLDPLNVAFNRNLGEFHFRTGQLKIAIEILHRTIEMDPTFPLTHLYLGYIYTQMSMYEEALAEIRKETRLPTVFHGSQVGIVYARMGRREEALRILNQYMELEANEVTSPYALAALCVALGEIDLCFQLLEKAFEAHDMYLYNIKADFLMDGVRTDARFTALLKKMGLDQ